MAGKGNKGRAQSIGFFHMLRDVLIAAINKGQFPMAIVGGLAALMIFRMPPEDISKLVFRLLDGIEKRWLIGDILACVALAGWFFHARYQRRIINAEMDRISDERNRTQSKALGNVKLPSSGGHR